ncbi:HDL191Cp [Eremothecium sinecaudum]|uniref:Phosphodiesterase n=1 Tax=Eremothecium sinecaudum TaxID=45286 RepID=A0A120K266_9SACH|nr:HDL191Cp [Eremothecium sinecaudum]AMD20553.1 HDL191Cp [Eremothecium sinecaudum]
MMHIFFVNCAKKEVPSGLECCVGHFKVLRDLLQEVLEKRLNNKEDFEQEISIVVYDDNEQELSLPETQTLLKIFLPCLNIKVSNVDDWQTTLQLALKCQQRIAVDKVTSSEYWMYSKHVDCHSGVTPCSLNMYSMTQHLARLNDAQEDQNNGVLVRFLNGVNIKGIMEVPKSTNYYWSQLNTWDFSAHSLNTLELIACARLIITKLCLASNTPCLSEDELNVFLIHLECAYHQVNKFHNFRHALDVMQATYKLCDLLKLDPGHSLALCISAVGHDVGHPGTNNDLFSSFGSPISKQYADNSVLENFHTDIFTGILRQHWPQYTTSLNLKNIKEAIISTDMALHNRYLKQLSLSGTEKLRNNIPLLTSLIIKAADISNVSRPLLVSAQWAVLLAYELNDCILLEKKLKGQSVDVKQSKLGRDVDLPDSVEDIVARFPRLPKDQLFFIDTFVLDLFAGLADKFKEVRFIHENIQSNRDFWLQQ